MDEEWETEAVAEEDLLAEEDEAEVVENDDTDYGD